MTAHNGTTENDLACDKCSGTDIHTVFHASSSGCIRDCSKCHETVGIGSCPGTSSVEHLCRYCRGCQFTFVTPTKPPKGPPRDALVKCIVCARDTPWGLWDSRTNATVCFDCRDARHRLTTLADALKPFASMAYSAHWPDDEPIAADCRRPPGAAPLTVGDFRRAAIALSGVAQASPETSDKSPTRGGSPNQPDRARALREPETRT